MILINFKCNDRNNNNSASLNVVLVMIIITPVQFIVLSVHFLRKDFCMTFVNLKTDVWLALEYRFLISLSLYTKHKGVLTYL